MITRERLESRRKELEEQKAQLGARLNATIGAIQLLNELLSEKEEANDSGGVPAEGS